MIRYPNLPRNIVPALILCLVLLCTSTLLAQTAAPLWGDLETGPHAVGFRTLETHDYSRVVLPKRDYFGNVVPGDRSRSIQALVWYPAVASEDALTMVLGEYIFPSPSNDEFFQFVTAMQNRDIGVMNFLFQGDQGLMLDAQNIEMAAVRDLRAAEGTFPVILYCPDLTGGFSDNFVLCEYLASHGFVVLTVHPYALNGRQMTGTPADIETMARDLETGLAMIRDLEFVDNDRLAIVGARFGGLVARVLQMRNSDIDVLVDLNGWAVRSAQLDNLTDNAFFDTRRASVPQLTVIPDSTAGYDLALVDSCRYARRMVVKLPDVPMGGFRAYHAVRGYMTAADGGPVLVPSYETTCRYVRQYLNANLLADSTAQAWLAAAVEGAAITAMEARELPPSPDQWVGILRAQGAAEAVRIYRHFNEQEPGSIVVPEATLNVIGYQLLQGGQAEDAVTMFKLNAETYPSSTNVWDSYADGLRAVGDTATIIMCYRKVLETLPDDSTTNEQLKATLQTNAEQGLAEFGATQTEE